MNRNNDLSTQETVSSTGHGGNFISAGDFLSYLCNLEAGNKRKYASGSDQCESQRDNETGDQQRSKVMRTNDHPVTVGDSQRDYRIEDIVDPNNNFVAGDADLNPDRYNRHKVIILGNEVQQTAHGQSIPAPIPRPSIHPQPQVVTVQPVGASLDLSSIFPLKTMAEFEALERKLISGDHCRRQLISFMRQYDTYPDRQMLLKTWLHQDAVFHISFAGRMDKKKVLESPFFLALLEAWTYDGKYEFPYQVKVFLERAHQRCYNYSSRQRLASQILPAPNATLP